MKNPTEPNTETAELAAVIANILDQQKKLAARIDILAAIGVAEQCDGGARWQPIKLVAREMSDDVFDGGECFETLTSRLGAIFPGLNDALEELRT